jgi:hypothetical protein
MLEEHALAKRLDELTKRNGCRPRRCNGEWRRQGTEHDDYDSGRSSKSKT